MCDLNEVEALRASQTELTEALRAANELAEELRGQLEEHEALVHIHKQSEEGYCNQLELKDKLLKEWQGRTEAAEAALAQAQADALVMALRLLGEDPDSFAIETEEVMDRWGPVALSKLQTAHWRNRLL